MYNKHPQRIQFPPFTMTLRMTPELHSQEEAPVRCCWTRLWFTCNSSSLWLTFSDLHWILWLFSKYTHLQQGNGAFPEFSYPVPPGRANWKPSNKGTAPSYSSPCPSPSNCMLHSKAALTGYSLALIVYLDSKHSRKAVLYALHKYGSKSHPAFQLKLIYLTTYAALLPYKHF